MIIQAIPLPKILEGGSPHPPGIDTHAPRFRRPCSQQPWSCPKPLLHDPGLLLNISFLRRLLANRVTPIVQKIIVSSSSSRANYASGVAQNSPLANFSTIGLSAHASSISTSSISQGIGLGLVS